MSAAPRAVGLALAIGCALGACSAAERPTGGAASPSVSTSSPAPSRSAVPTPVVVTPAPPAANAPMPPSVPVRVQIPSIGVDSELMELGLKSDGSLQVPPRGFPAGWYSGAPTPGEKGPAIIAGHVDWSGPAVFYRLRDLKPADEVTVARADGSQAVFRVTEIKEFPKAAFPTALVYGDIAVAGLRLITCGGVFNHATGHYDDNIVAFAELVRHTP